MAPTRPRRSQRTPLRYSLATKALNSQTGGVSNARQTRRQVRTPTSGDASDSSLASRIAALERAASLAPPMAPMRSSGPVQPTATADQEVNWREMAMTLQQCVAVLEAEAIARRPLGGPAAEGAVPGPSALTATILAPTQMVVTMSVPATSSPVMAGNSSVVSGSTNEGGAVGQQLGPDQLSIVLVGTATFIERPGTQPARPEEPSWDSATRNRDVNYLKLPPGPPPLPIIGNILQVKTNNLDKALAEIGEKYGPVYMLHFGGKRIVVLFGYKAVKEALVEHALEFAPRGDMPLFDQLRNGLGVIFGNGEKWKQLRRFTLTTLRDFGMGKKSNEERIQEEAQCLLQKLRETKGKPFDPTFIFNMALANIICAIVFGKRYGYEDKRFLQLTTYIHELFVTWSSSWGQLYNLFPSFMTFVYGPHQKFKAIDAILNEFILEEIEQHRDTLDANIPRDFIDCFLIKMNKEKENNPDEFNIKNLVPSISDVVFAGTETSSTTTRYGIQILLKYPEIEEKVHEEIDQVIGKIRRPCLADRIHMPYTNAVIHEIQRFTSLVPTYPHAVFKDTPFRQYIIPKGTIVYPLFTSVLQSSEEFPNPKDFDPHHFLHENGTFRNSDHFIPFSAGKRICAGEGLAKAELFLFLTTILQNFTLKSVIPCDKINLTPKSSSVVSIPREFKVCLLPR